MRGVKGNNYRKIVQIILCFVLFLAGLFIVIKIVEKDRELHVYKDFGREDVYLTAEKDGVCVNAIYNGAIGVYLCLPSFFNADVICFDDSIESIYIDGELIEDKWDFEYDYFYWCEMTCAGEKVEFSFCILKSGNMNAMFIDTESGNMNYVIEEKGNKEAGELRVYDRSGRLVCNGDLEYIRGRGNSTWTHSFKLPYSIKFMEKIPLMGMDSAKKWVLLANALDSSKLANAIAQDMARGFGMSTTIEYEWVDLYLNGNYAGNYLVTESIDIEEVDSKARDLQDATELLNPQLKYMERIVNDKMKGIIVSENPENISGTYIVERDLEYCYSEEVSGFKSEDGNYFSIKEPKYASVEQVEYIRDVVQNVEDKINSKSDDLFEYIDIKSLASQYFVDTIMGNCDMNITSMYYYKKYNDDKLYVGPVWDYDKSFGDTAFGYYHYEKEAFHLLEQDVKVWLAHLLENEEFMAYCKEFYADVVRPYVVYLVKDRLDDYAAGIQASYTMDHRFWTGNSKFYKTLDSNIRYIKFYLTKRIELMDEKFGVSGEKLEFSGNGIMHTVTLMYEDREESFEVLDGACFTELGEFDPTLYYWWAEAESNKKFEEWLPILEDLVLCPVAIE